eukprot:CAMPEP_0182463794 /NCGR_PEP_ID=MMETSP1319-20130603/7951_1 /TAXON_ID=172717 /ORGANISM="Bolidomonas pacifica, Strain RCC208" /LENGTH=50 /DNA_ID=CAMNT_0024663379 /DNA_START=454 /DNA_END=606 /DNA_ORIENTATION=-
MALLQSELSAVVARHVEGHNEPVNPRLNVERRGDVSVLEMQFEMKKNAEA